MCNDGVRFLFRIPRIDVLMCLRYCLEVAMLIPVVVIAGM